MRKNATKLICRTILVLACCLPVVEGFVTSAEAQQFERRRTLMDLFFGDRRPRAQPEAPPRAVPRAQRREDTRAKTNRSVTTIKTRQPAVAAKPAVEKLANAKKVLVVGDFVAGGLGEGLKAAFEDAPGVIVDVQSNGSSGLVRADYFNWPDELRRMIAERKPDVVVVQIGANDRQQIVTDGSRLDFRTEPWFAAYANRAITLGQVARETRLPLVWVGLPAFQSPTMTADALRLNTIYRTETEKVGGEFVDVWDGFVDQDGRFVVTGSDINGQPVRLRGSDGINFTSAGKRKLAFYAEKSVRRLLGDTTGTDLVKLDSKSLPTLQILSPAHTSGPMTTPPIDLFDPELDGATELLGSETASAQSAFSSPRRQLVETGTLPPPPPGRVDYVQLPATASAGKVATP